MNITNFITPNSCRICLVSPGTISIHEIRGDTTISAIIMMFSNVNIDPTDNLPDSICQSCELKVETVYQLKQEVEKSDITLRQLFPQQQILETNYFKLEVSNPSEQEELLLPAEYYEIREVEVQHEIQEEEVEECLVISDTEEESQEESEQTLVKTRKKGRQKLSQASDEQRRIRNERAKQRLLNETPEEREARLFKIRSNYIKRYKTNVKKV